MASGHLIFNQNHIRNCIELDFDGFSTRQADEQIDKTYHWVVWIEYLLLKMCLKF